jgi:aldehyde:ferredoxin oxidoreductase
MERQFNLAAGFTRDDDTLPHRVLNEPAKGGAGDGQMLELDSMLDEYYTLRGWNEQGVPNAETLKRLGL